MENDFISEKLERVYSLATNPEDFLRESGEFFAICDNLWKEAKNRHEPVDMAIGRMLAASHAHFDALELCSLFREELGAMISVLITIDMSRVNTCVLGRSYIDLHIRFLKGCIRLCRECRHDSYALPHAEAILRHEAAIFPKVLSCSVGSPETDGLIKACKSLTEDRNNDQSGDASDAERYVDIFARLHAIDN